MTAHQDIQTRLRSYLRAAFTVAENEERWPTVGEISKASIPYLDAVIEETLRYAAVANIVIRRATCDTQVLGHWIPEGTDMVLPLTGPSINQPSLYVPESSRSEASQHAKDHIPAWGVDISEYKPERWLKRMKGDNGEEKEVFDPTAGPNLAFATGPRQCFGKRLAYIELRTLVTLLMWNFEFEAVDEALSGNEIIERLVNLPKDCYIQLKKIS